MALCQVIRRKHRKLCAGDLRDDIQILDRSIAPPEGGSADYTIDINDTTAPFIGASISTPAGKKMFDGTGTEYDITHIFGVYYEPEYTSENYVLFESRLFRILFAEDLEERHEWTLLYCTERGTTDNAVNLV
tara:strand:+ start:7915 stop:8310 length:396 start_codon:yes stop_codon:yes gene_type:complete